MVQREEVTGTEFWHGAQSLLLVLETAREQAESQQWERSQREQALQEGSCSTSLVPAQVSSCQVSSR